MNSKANMATHQQKLLMLYEVLSDCDRAILRSKNRADLFAGVCRHVAQLQDVKLVWIGTMDVGDPKIWPQAHFGKNQNYAEFIQTMVNLPQGDRFDPLSLAVRENRPVWMPEVHGDSTAPGTINHATDRSRVAGWQSGAVLPLTVGGLPVGVLVIHANTASAFDAVARKLLTQLASNISYALDFFEHDRQRQEAEATLAESEVRYSALFASSSMPMVLVNPDSGLIVDANIRAVNFYGWDQATLTAKKVMDINVLSAEEIRREMALAVSTKKSYFDFKHRLASGEVRDVEVFSSPVSFGGQTYLLSVIHDVTERRRVEARVHSMQTLIQQFIDELPGTAYLKDAQMRLLMVNKSLGLALGVDPQTLIGKTAHDIFSQEFADTITELDRQMLSQGGRRTVEETYLGRHFETSMFALDSETGERLLGGLSRDVTDHYRAVERTRALLSINELGGQLPEKAFLTRGLEIAQALTQSTMGFLHFVNEDQETLELVTWTAGALKGCSAAYDSHYPISQAGIWADCARVKKAVMFNDYASYPAKHGLPEGHTPLTRLISVPVIEGGKVRLMMGVGNKAGDYDTVDVDALSLIGNDLWRIVCRARAESALHKQVADLVQANQKLAEVQLQLLQSEKMASIGQLAAGVAHEINNPVGFVKSNLGTLTKYVDDLLAIAEDYASIESELDATAASRFERVRQHKVAADYDFLLTDLPQLIQESIDGVERVGRIVLDLKIFSRSGETEWAWADLQAGIESTINVVWNQLKYKAKLTCEWADLPQVYCVSSQINQAVMNLLVNAGQAITDQGQITVRTGLDGDQVWIEVQDNGCGISPENKARIFDPFYTSKPVGEGTGLGLSISFGIVQQHHGKIVVHSALEVGSTFRIVLPVDWRTQELKP